MATFLEQFDALDTPGRAALTQQYLAQKPNELFAELRANRPILTTPIGVLVSKADDVRSVLSRGNELTVKLYAVKMERITGPFMLGMQDSARYRREAALLRVTFPDPEITDLTGRFATMVHEQLQPARATGRIDIVSQLTRAVPTRFVQEFYGVPGPSADSLQRWARTIFHDIFINLGNDAAVRENADASAAEMIPYLDELIAAREKSPTGGDTVLERLLRMRDAAETSLTPEVIRHNLIGMIVGTIDTTSKAAAYAVDWLLSNDTAREQAMTANASLFTRYVLEAMRFAPQANILTRLCETRTDLAVGKAWQTTVAPGTIIFAGIGSAMFDPESIPDPDEFRADRVDSMYFHFGHGQHSCFGRYINPIQICEMIRGVLLLPNLRRAAGPDGTLQQEGPFPSKLVVECDPE